MRFCVNSRNINAAVVVLSCRSQLHAWLESSIDFDVLLKHLAMKQILITGATGFVGSHAIESALASGFQVTAVARSRVLEPLPGVEYRQVDLFDEEQVSYLVKSIRPSNLLHTAWV